MKYRYFVQDPSNQDTVYLIESLFAALDEAAHLTAVFAFASKGGVDALFDDEVVKTLLLKGRCLLVVGLDAITNRAALERLSDLEREYSGLTVRVFWNPSQGLFHPKLAEITKRDGRRVVIVGSGNLTPGGLRENLEAYSVAEIGAGSKAMSPLEAFLDRHAADIRPIDSDALDRAARNVFRGGRRRKDAEPDITEGPAAPEDVASPISDRVLVAEVPKAGNRWHQVHFNKDVIAQFFRAKENSAERVYLTERNATGSLGSQEIRPVVYSDRNKNFKIELGARRDESYPKGASRPIVVLRETQLRTFDYLVLMPGDEGYDDLAKYLSRSNSVGRGARRVITSCGELRTVWPACPLC